jgi:integrase/recombinase XerD
MKPGDLSLHLEAYLALKKALGFPLGARERLLRDFVAFAESNGVRGTINAQVAFDWACSVSDRCGMSGKVARLSVARQFLFHLSAVVPGIEVPSATLLARPRRRKPFLFCAEEISRLLRAALSLRPQGSAGRHKAGVGPGIAAVTTIGYFGFLVGPPLIGTLASLFSLPAALSLVIVFGLIIANSARHAVAGP